MVMPFTVIEFRDLIRILHTQPEWRAELLRVLFPEALVDLPRAQEELAEAQRRTEETLDRVTERMERGFVEAAADRKRIWEAMQQGFVEAAADRKRIWENIERLTERMERGFAEAAAERAGITRVLLPERNRPDVESARDRAVPEGLGITYVSSVEDALREALAVMEAWGFTYKTHAISDKQIIGMGYWFRGRHELLLVGTKGHFSPPASDCRIPSFIGSRRTKHSRKPEEARRLIELAQQDVTTRWNMYEQLAKIQYASPGDNGGDSKEG